jgi:hypothetical protein
LATLDFIGLLKQCKTLLDQISAIIKKHVPVKYQYEHDKPYQTFLLIVEKHQPVLGRHIRSHPSYVGRGHHHGTPFPYACAALS